MNQNLVNEKIICYHCGEDCPSAEIYIEDKFFCCTGCKTVFEILNENNLCNYYSFDEKPGRKPSSAEKRFDYLDDTQVLKKLISFQNETVAYVTFFIPQIHCTSCIWILENLYRLNRGIFHSEVNFLDKTVLVKYYKEKVSLKEIVTKLASVGYEPLLQLDSIDSKQAVPQNKKLLYQLGVAGFCFGNIMLLSFPEYLSLHISEVFYRNLFGYLNFILSLPVLFYSASDYFISAFTSLKKKIININLPLSIGIAVLFARSCFEVFTSSGAGYFDSMTGLVFLLLIGKYVQQRTYSSLNFERDYKSYFPLSVIRKENGRELSIPVSELRKGDRIVIRNNEIIPGDSILFSGTAFIDYSFLTGESALAEIKAGGLIYAGGKHNGSIIELEVVKEVSQSYLTRLWNNPVFEKDRGKDFSHFTNTISRHFTAGIILVSVISSYLWLPDWYMAMDVFTAVLIVACPCALALSVPFTYGNAQRIFGKNRMYLRNSLHIEDLSASDIIVFDKTGTITRMEKSEVTYSGRELSDEEKYLIKSASKNSVHPLSRRITDLFSAGNNIEPDFFSEVQGEGIQAEFGGRTVRLGSLKYTSPDSLEEKSSVNKTHVHVSINNSYAGFFEIKNAYREGIPAMISALKNDHSIYLLSGDNEGEREALSKYFNEDKLLFNQSPHDKLDFIKRMQLNGKKITMVGDGLNDAGALSQSNFGISVTENISNFSPACDAILDSSSLNKMNNFLKFSKDSAKIIHLNFIVSLLYNLGGLSFAVNGLLTPLIAAVLMPLSSITVVAIAAAGTTIAARRRGLK